MFTAEKSAKRIYCRTVVFHPFQVWWPSHHFRENEMKSMPFWSPLFDFITSMIRSMSKSFTSRNSPDILFLYSFISSSHLSRICWFFIFQLAVRSFLVAYIVVGIYRVLRLCVNRIRTFHVLSGRCLFLNIVGLNVAIIDYAKTLLKQFRFTCRLKTPLVK